MDPATPFHDPDPGVAPPFEHAHDLALPLRAQRLEQHPVPRAGVTRMRHLPDAPALLLDAAARLIPHWREDAFHEAVAAAQAVARAEPVQSFASDQLLEQAAQGTPGARGKLERTQQRGNRERRTRATLERAQHPLRIDGRLASRRRATATPAPRARFVSVAAAGQVASSPFAGARLRSPSARCAAPSAPCQARAVYATPAIDALRHAA